MTMRVYLFVSDYICLCIWVTCGMLAICVCVFGGGVASELENSAINCWQEDGLRKYIQEERVEFPRELERGGVHRGVYMISLCWMVNYWSCRMENGKLCIQRYSAFGDWFSDPIQSSVILD